MPSISYNNNGGVIRWDADDWLRGLSSDWGFNGQSVRSTRGLGYTSSLDPNRRPGYLLPGFSYETATNSNVVDGTIRNAIVHNDKAYLVGGTKIHEYDIATNAITNAGVFPHTIDHSHTNEIGDDIVAYYVSGTKYAFYSFNDATDGDVGRYDFATTFDDDWMSTVPTSGAVLNKSYPHPMIVGDDNILYIGNGANLASYNGTTNVFNTAAVDLPTGYVITSYSKTQNFLVIYAYRQTDSSSLFRTECAAFFWDYLSDTFTYVYPLAGNYVDGGFNNNSIPGCFVSGYSFDSRKINKMLLFNGSYFKREVVFEDSIPIKGGVEAFDDVIMWNAGGQIYQYGSQHPGFDRTLNKPMAGSGTLSGMFKMFKNATFHSSSGNSIDEFESGYNIATAITNLAKPRFPKNQKGRVELVKVYWLSQDQMTGTNFDLSLNVDKNSTTYRPIKDINSISELVTEYHELETGEAASLKLQDLLFESVGLSMNWGNAVASAPIGVDAVEIHFSYVNI